MDEGLQVVYGIDYIYVNNDNSFDQSTVKYAKPKAQHKYKDIVFQIHYNDIVNFNTAERLVKLFEKSVDSITKEELEVLFA